MNMTHIMDFLHLGVAQNVACHH